MRWKMGFFLLFACLCGCAAGRGLQFETVCDELPTCAVEDAPYEIRVELPPEVEQTAHTDEGVRWRALNGDYTITTQILVCDSLDAAVYAISGLDQPQLRFNREDGTQECQFAWCCEDEGKQAVCRALVCRKGDYCYALCFRLKEGLSGTYNSQINCLFSSFALE